MPKKNNTEKHGEDWKDYRCASGQRAVLLPYPTSQRHPREDDAYQHEDGYQHQDFQFRVCVHTLLVLLAEETGPGGLRPLPQLFNHNTIYAAS